MKILRLIGNGGIELVRCQVNITGDNLVLAFPIPIYYPIAFLVLEEVSEKQVKDKKEVKP